MSADSTGAEERSAGGIEPRRFAGVRVGESLPPLTRRATSVSLFMFGAAYWSPHRIHYDRDHARDEGYDDVVVTGPLMNAWAVRALTEWAGDPGCLRRIAVRNLAPAYVGDSLTVTALVTGKRPGEREGEVDCEFQVAGRGGAAVLRGTATLGLPLE